MKRKASKRKSSRQDVGRLEDIPTVGPAIAGALRRLGITSPAELLGRDPYAMYDDLCRITGQRRTPSVVVSRNRIASMRSMSAALHITLSMTPGRFFFIWIGTV